MYFYYYHYVFLLYVYVWLPWLRFNRAFYSVVRQMPGYNPQRRGTARTLPNFCAVLCIVCVFLCIFCVVLCIFLLFYILFVLCCSMYFFVLFCVFLCYSIYCLFCVVLCIVCVVLCIFVLFYVFLCYSVYCLFCVVLCIICMHMCTVLLSPGGYPIAVKYRVSHELRSLLRESVPYVKIYRYNPKHLRPNLNGYGDNGQRKVGCFLRFHLLHLLSWRVTRQLRMSVLESVMQSTVRLPCKVLGTLKDDCGVNGYMSLIR
jgi:hypothetical protein